MCVVVAALPQQTARQKLTESGVLKQKEVSLENYGGVKKGTNTMRENVRFVV